MEGVSGINTIRQVERTSDEFTDGRILLEKEINQAVDACYENGADRVYVCDTHAGGGQVDLLHMDDRAIYEMPSNGLLMPSLDSTFDGVILLGHHAMAGTLNGFLDHTFLSSEWFACRINGNLVGEIGVEAAYAGHFDVPVMLVAGDAAATYEASALLGHVECAVVKWGLGRNSARCLPVSESHQVIRQAIARAMSSACTFKALKYKLPATLRVTLCRSDFADRIAGDARIRRVDARVVEIEIASFRDIMRWNYTP